MLLRILLLIIDIKQMSAGENIQKRQQFRLQIRRRQKFHKFAQLRQEYLNQEAQHKTTDNYVGYVSEIQAIMEGIATVKNNRVWPQVLLHLRSFANQMEARVINVDVCQTLKPNVLLEMGLNFFLETNAIQVEQICNNDIPEDEPSSGVPPQMNCNAQFQTSFPALIILEIIHSAFHIFKYFPPTQLSKQSKTCLINLLVPSLLKLLAIKEVAIFNDKFRYLHLEAMASVLSLLKTLVLSQAQNQSTPMEVLMSKGIPKELTQIVWYNLQFDTLFKHSLLSIGSSSYEQTIIDLHINTFKLIFECLKLDKSIGKQQHYHMLDSTTQNRKCFFSYALYVFQATSDIEGSIEKHKHLLVISLKILIFLLEKEEISSVLLANNSFTPFFAILLNEQHYDEQFICQILCFLEIVCRDYEGARYILIKKHWILNLVEEGLVKLSQSLHDHGKPFQMFQRRLKQYSQIIFNLLQSKNEQITTLLYVHPIWDTIFNLLQRNTQLYCKLLTLFPAYFTCFKSQAIMKNLPYFLQICSNLDLNNEYREDMLEIRQIICEVYYKSKSVLDEQQIERVKIYYKSYGKNELLLNDRVA